MKTKAHKWRPFRSGRKSTAAITWPVCDHCGLVALTNDATRAAIKKSCPGSEPD